MSSNFKFSLFKFETEENYYKFNRIPFNFANDKVQPEAFIINTPMEEIIFDDDKQNFDTFQKELTFGEIQNQNYSIDTNQRVNRIRIFSYFHFSILHYENFDDKFNREIFTVVKEQKNPDQFWKSFLTFVNNENKISKSEIDINQIQEKYQKEIDALNLIKKKLELKNENFIKNQKIFEEKIEKFQNENFQLQKKIDNFDQILKESNENNLKLRTILNQQNYDLTEQHNFIERGKKIHKELNEEHKILQDKHEKLQHQKRQQDLDLQAAQQKLQLQLQKQTQENEFHQKQIFELNEKLQQKQNLVKNLQNENVQLENQLNQKSQEFQVTQQKQVEVQSHKIQTEKEKNDLLLETRQKFEDLKLQHKFIQQELQETQSNLNSKKNFIQDLKQEHQKILKDKEEQQNQILKAKEKNIKKLLEQIEIFQDIKLQKIHFEEQLENLKEKNQKFEKENFKFKQKILKLEQENSSNNLLGLENKNLTQQNQRLQKQVEDLEQNFNNNFQSNTSKSEEQIQALQLELTKKEFQIKQIEKEREFDKKEAQIKIVKNEKLLKEYEKNFEIYKKNIDKNYQDKITIQKLQAEIQNFKLEIMNLNLKKNDLEEKLKKPLEISQQNFHLNELPSTIEKDNFMEEYYLKMIEQYKNQIKELKQNSKMENLPNFPHFQKLFLTQVELQRLNNLQNQHRFSFQQSQNDKLLQSQLTEMKTENQKLTNYVDNYKINTEMLENKIELLTEKYEQIKRKSQQQRQTLKMLEKKDLLNRIHQLNFIKSNKIKFFQINLFKLQHRNFFLLYMFLILILNLMYQILKLKLFRPNDA